MPIAWLSIIPPVPTCLRCGATKKTSYGPTIDMEPKKKTYTYDDIEEILNKD